MRRLMALVISLGIFCASAFSSAAITSGKVEKQSSAPGAAASVRITKMRAAGLVIEISDRALKIERKVKDKVENMEFALEKPLVKIKVGDKVRVSYTTKADQNIATKVMADIPQKVTKKPKTPEGKVVPAGLTPARK